MLNLSGLAGFQTSGPQQSNPKLQPNFASPKSDDESAPKAEWTELTVSVIGVQTLSHFLQSVYEETKTLNHILQQTKGFIAENGFEHDLSVFKSKSEQSNDSSTDNLVFEFSVQDPSFRLDWK